MALCIAAAPALLLYAQGGPGATSPSGATLKHVPDDLLDTSWLRTIADAQR
jgi:hypothetical protein